MKLDPVLQGLSSSPCVASNDSKSMAVPDEVTC